MQTANHSRKGIILAGGSGTRLFPLTRVVSKQLLPIYDKPMVYYPLSTLMQAGIRDILIISTPDDVHAFQRLFGDGSQLGLSIEYEVQPRPEGLAQAFIIGRRFVGSDHCALVLGDNVLYGPRLRLRLRLALERNTGATIFGYVVDEPQHFGVVEFNAAGVAVSLQEKPALPRSAHAVPGLYFYDNRVLEIAAQLKPSLRGELEITDVNRAYLESGALHVEKLSQEFTWLDAGTHESLLEASQFVHDLEEEQGVKIGCIEEVAYRERYIDAAQLERLAQSVPDNYGRYLLDGLKNGFAAEKEWQAAGVSTIQRSA